MATEPRDLCETPKAQNKSAGVVCILGITTHLICIIWFLDNLKMRLLEVSEASCGHSIDQNTSHRRTFGAY